MPLFQFSLLRRKFRYPLIMCFFYLLEQFFFLCYIKEVNPPNDDKDDISFSPIYHPFILVWLRFIVQMFGIIPLLIQSKLSKSEKIQTIIQVPENAEGKEGKSQFSWRILLILIGLSLSESITNAFGIIFDNFPYSLFKICSQTLLIIFTSLICVRFLKYEYFKHHNLSIVLIFCASIVYAIFDTLEDNGTLKANSFIHIGQVLIVLILRGSQECIEKWLMDKKYLSPYFIMFIEGLSGFIITSLCFPLFSTIHCHKESVYYCEGDHVEHFTDSMRAIFASGNPNYVIFLILYMISNYFFVIFKFFTNKSLSPSHRSISDILGLFCIWVLRRTILEEAFHLKLITQPNAGINPNKTISQVTVDIVKCISYLVMIFAMFVFLEILILPFCNFETNTDSEIDSRSFKERESLNNLLELELKRETTNEQNEADKSTDEIDIPPNDF